MNRTITQELELILSRDIDTSTCVRASHLFLDWIACSVAGQKEVCGQIITSALKSDTGQCTRIGSTPSSILTAALHNGILGNILEMDDVDKRGILHPAPTVIPAAFAMAEHTQAQPTDFLCAIVMGYEATIRIGRAVGPNHYKFWHNTATCGTFGAATAGCALLPDSNLVSALGLAGTQSAGLWQTRHENKSMAKQLHTGHACHAGILAAILSSHGFVGPKSILEGPQGFFKAMCNAADPYDVVSSPHADWLIHETSIKPYAACRHAHAAIDAALLARKSDDGVSPIRVNTYDDALTFCDKPHPQSNIETKFSLQFAVAKTMKDGAPEINDFTLESAQHPDLKPWLDRIEIISSPSFNNSYPAHYGTTIEMGDQYFEVTDAYGDPENPVPISGIIEKSKMLFHYADIPREKSEELIQTVLNLPDSVSLKPLIRQISEL